MRTAEMGETAGEQSRYGAPVSTLRKIYLGFAVECILLIIGILRL